MSGERCKSHAVNVKQSVRKGVAQNHRQCRSVVRPSTILLTAYNTGMMGDATGDSGYTAAAQSVGQLRLNWRRNQGLRLRVRRRPNVDFGDPVELRFLERTWSGGRVSVDDVEDAIDVKLDFVPAGFLSP